MNVPLLTPVQRRGEPRCSAHENPSEPPCGQPATWHIAWWLTPKADFSLVCDAHMAWAQRTFAYADRHPAAVACDMPGTGWAQRKPSFCTIPPEETGQS